MIEDKAILELTQTTLEGKIKGFKIGIERIKHPEIKKQIEFTLNELEEVLKVINEMKK